MLIAHLAFGILCGALAAVLGDVMGLTFGGIVGCYVVGANVGLLASLPAALLGRPGRAARLAPVPAYRRPPTAAPLR